MKGRGRNRIGRRVGIGSFLLLGGVITSQTLAAEVSWTGANSISWGTSANWSGGAPANNLWSDIAVFDAESYTRQPNVPATSNVDPDRSVGGLLFSGSGAVTLSAGGDGLAVGIHGITFEDGAGDVTITSTLRYVGGQTWTNASDSTLALNGTTTRLTAGSTAFNAHLASLNLVVTGGGAITSTTLTNDATGILNAWTVFNGADWVTNTGGTLGAYASYVAYVNPDAGDVVNSNNTRLTSSADMDNSFQTHTLKIANTAAGSLQIATGKVLTVQGTGILFTGTDDYTIAGGSIRPTSTANTAATLHVNHYGTGLLTIDSNIVNTGSGAASLLKAGPGTLALAGSKSFTGSLVVNGGLVRIDSLGSFGNAYLSGGGGIQYAADFVGDTDLSARFAPHSLSLGAGGGVIHTNGNDVAFTRAIGTITTNTTSSTGHAQHDGRGGFTKDGDGTLTLEHVSLYSGPTVIKGGVLSVGTATPIPTYVATVNATSNTTLTLQAGFDTSSLFPGQTVQGARAGTTSIANIINNNQVRLFDNGSTTSGASVTFVGLDYAGIGDGGQRSSIGSSSAAASNLVFDGGILRYTGAAASTDRLFTVTGNGGGIEASGADNAALVFNNTGSIEVTGTQRTLTLGGTSTGENTLNPVISDGAAGVTSLSKTGVGTWVLAGINSYSGMTSIHDGTLKLTGDVNNIAGSSHIIVGTGDVEDAAAVLHVAGISDFTLGGTQKLSGRGTVVGSVATSANSTLTGGGSAGTLSFANDLTVTEGTMWELTVGGPKSTGIGNVTQTLILPTTAASVVLNLSGGDLEAGTYTLFTYEFLTGGNTVFADTFVFGTAPAGGFDVDFVNNTSSKEVQMLVSVVPEPSSLSLLGVAAVAMRRRRRIGTV